MEKPKFPEFKVVFVGNSSVGKTSIIMRFHQGSFSADRQSTIGSAFISKEIVTQYGPAILQIWDTAGQERYRSLVPMYTRGAFVAVVVFDVTEEESFDAIDEWIANVKSEVSQSCRNLVAGNKCDLSDQMDRARIERWRIANGFDVIFLSAKTGENVDLLFGTVAELLPAMRFGLPPPSSADLKEADKKSGCC
jgi:small GTP-binding protein